MIDGFCCAGGAGEGYRRAGWEVVGVDNKPQPNYRAGRFVKMDALKFIRENWQDFDAVHTSPPCQAKCALTTGTNEAMGWGNVHVDLIPDTRETLASLTIPTILENVPGSGIRRDLILCGEMFGLRVIRRRYFEINGFTVESERCNGNAHHEHRGRVRGYRHGENYPDGYYVAVYGDGGGKGSVADWQSAMGIHWTSEKKELAEAIPPAFTERIGSQLIRSL